MDNTGLNVCCSELIEALLDRVQAVLDDNLVGFYLRGSLALGGFNKKTSDVDVLVVTESPVSGSEFEALRQLHERIDARNNVFGRHYEVSYIDRASVRRFSQGETHPTVGADWAFCWGEHRDNFVLERWTVREHGVVVLGPCPKTLIDPITIGELQDAVVSELAARGDDWAADQKCPNWLRPKYYQAFEIETLCRALYTLELGKMPTKPEAVEWALATLPDPWCELVRWSQVYRADKTEDDSKFSDVMQFARWATQEARTMHEK